MPDALMKTIPIWCAVFNRLLFPSDQEVSQLFTPPKCVSASEHAQISQRIPAFLSALQDLHLDIHDLRQKVGKPLRPIWVTRDSELPNEPPVFEDFHPLVLCTASKRVVGGEISEGGYIQGAGDDAEAWSHGLIPPLFWKHHEGIMDTPEEELPDLINALLEREKTSSAGRNVKPTSIKNAPWLSIASFAALNPMAVFNFDAIVTIGSRDALPNVPIPKRKHMLLTCRDRKLGSRDLRAQLPLLKPFINQLASTKRVLICDATGKDLAAGVALAVLCLYADEEGRFVRADDEQGAGRRMGIDKTFIKRRLSWIVMSVPEAAPSRTTLQSINDYLLTEYTKTAVPITTPISSHRHGNGESKEEKPSPPPASDSTETFTSLAETIFLALEGTWILDREIVNHRGDGLAGKVEGRITFTPRTPTDGLGLTSGEYMYHEEGVFHAGPGIQMTVNRRWVWRLERPSGTKHVGDAGEEERGEKQQEGVNMSIHFVKADAETVDYLYNRLPLPIRAPTTPMEGNGEETNAVVVEAEHPCGKDFYVSRYTFYLKGGGEELEKWVVRHEVKGPAKDYVSTSVHTRA